MYLAALMIGFIAPAFIAFMFTGALSWLPLPPHSWLWSIPVVVFQLGVVPLYSNFLYFSSVERRMESLREKSGDDEAVLHALDRSSPTSVLSAVLLPVLLTGIGVLQQYAHDNRQIRDQVTSVLPQLALLKTAVVKGYLTNHRWPERTQDVVAENIISNQYLVDIRVDLGTISLHFGNRASPLIANRMLSLRPSLTPTGAIVWTCGYAPQKGKDPPGTPAGPDLTNVEPRYLPSECR
jgi:hypothetical protein